MLMANLQTILTQCIIGVIVMYMHGYNAEHVTTAYVGKLANRIWGKCGVVPFYKGQIASCLLVDKTPYLDLHKLNSLY